MKKILTFFAILTFVNVDAQNYTLDSTVLSSRIVIDSIDIPWEIIWGPDDHIWMTERFGRVSRVNPQTGQQNIILDISSNVYAQFEAGLLGMALHPNFDNQPFVYLVYTYQSGSNVLERLVRYSYNGTSLVNPDILLDNIVGNSTHDGARLLFLPDTTLLMTTGDAQNLNLPQNTASLSGKVLRLNPDGTVPADNPIPGSFVYSWGHRNAQGLCLTPNGNIFCSEHGPSTDDELHIIRKAGNYGWPTVAGYCNTSSEISFCADSNVIEPLLAWSPTIAPSDLLWYSHPSIPEFQDKLLMTVLKDKKLIAFGLNNTEDSVISETHYFTNQLTRLRDICISPDGKIYLATNGSSWTNSSPFTHSIVELYNAAYIPNSREIIENKIVKVWPNPLKSGQILNLSYPEEKEVSIQIFSMSGVEVLSKVLNGENNLCLDLIPSIYLYRIKIGMDNVKTGKIIIK